MPQGCKYLVPDRSPHTAPHNAAPKPARPVVDVPPWEVELEQQRQQQQTADTAPSEEQGAIQSLLSGGACNEQWQDWQRRQLWQEQAQGHGQQQQQQQRQTHPHREHWELQLA